MWPLEAQLSVAAQESNTGLDEASLENPRGDRACQGLAVRNTLTAPENRT